MAGGLMQLSAYGSQDVYLTGNPQITFFKSVYRRYTNFSMESVEQTITGTKNFGQRIECKIERVGDLLTNLHVYFKLPAPTATVATFENWTNAVGYALLKQIDLEIGGERIDRQYGLWMDIWNELEDVNHGEWDLVGKVANPAFKQDASGNANDGNPHLDFAQDKSTEYYVPLRFWFCGNPALALPLIALQHQDIVLKIDIRSLNGCLLCTGEPGTITAEMTELKIFGDYIYLDVDERRKFAESSHEYLIEQLQFQTASITANKTNDITLTFNHPCKELIWVFQHTTSNAEASVNAYDPSDYTTADHDNGNDWFNYNGTAASLVALPNSVVDHEAPSSGIATDPFTTATITFNGRNRFTPRPPTYFKYLQPLYHYDNVPAKNVYAYSFALKPTEHQPSGTCNFSRLDNANLELAVSAGQTNLTVSMFARNYNVLRISSGVSGLAYSV